MARCNRRAEPRSVIRTAHVPMAPTLQMTLESRITRFNTLELLVRIPHPLMCPQRSASRPERCRTESNATC